MKPLALAVLIVACPALALSPLPLLAPAAGRPPQLLPDADLADAMQDAGCDNSDILDRCRQPGDHVRGCWVVDFILGKN